MSFIRKLHSKFDNSLSKFLYPYIILLILIYGYIFIVLMNYENAWMQPEITELYPYALSDGNHLTLNDFVKGFNIEDMEWRASRPRFLSSIFQIINIKFRIWLLKYFPPHPSFSLTWIFALVLSPVFLFKLVHNLINDDKIAFVTISLYLSLPGLLSPIVMLFHPGKVLTNFCLIWCLYQASVINLLIKQPNFSRKSFILRFIVLTTTIIFSFFWDETALFVWIAVPILFANIFISSPIIQTTIIIYLIPPFFYLFIVTFLLPLITYILQFQRFAFFGYANTGILNEISLKNFLLNYIYLFRDNLNIKLNDLYFYSDKIFNLRFLLVWLYQIFVTSFIFYVIFIFVKYKNIIKEQLPDILKFTLRLFAILVLYVIFHTIIMCRSVKLWGCWWYGAPFSIFFALLFCVFYKVISLRSKPVFFIMNILIIINSLYYFTYNNYAYKSGMVGLDSFDAQHIGNGLKSWQLYRPESASNYKLVYEAWKARKNSKMLMQIETIYPLDPKYWLIAELFPQVKKKKEFYHWGKNIKERHLNSFIKDGTFEEVVDVKEEFQPENQQGGKYWMINSLKAKKEKWIVYYGKYAAKLVTDSSSGRLRQTITNFEQLRGKVVRLTAYIKRKTISAVSVSINDGISTTEQDVNYPTDRYYLILLTKEISPKATKLSVSINVDAINAVVYVDDVKLVIIEKE